MHINQYVAEELAAEFDKMGDAPVDLLSEVFEWGQDRSANGVDYWLQDTHSKDIRYKALIVRLTMMLGEQLALNKWRSEKAREIAEGPKFLPGSLMDMYGERDE